MTDSVIHLVLTQPKKILLLFAILSGILAMGLSKLVSEPDFEKFLPGDHPEKLINDVIRETFNIGKPVMITIRNEGPVGIFNETTLEKISLLTEEVSELEGVISSSVMSLATERNITASTDGMTTDYFMDDPPTEAEDIKSLRDNVLNFDLLSGSLYSADSQMAAIIFDMEDEVDSAIIFEKISKLAAKYEDQENQINFTGDVIASGLIGKYIQIDMTVMIPLASLVVLIMLWLTFRALKAILLPFVVVGLSVLWTLGLHGWTGVHLSVLSPIIPVLLIAIGNTDGIHIISEYYQKSMRGASKQRLEVLREALRDVYKPVILTSLTSALGFLALLSSPIQQLREFGIFTAFGIMTAMFLSLAVVPALLILLKADVPVYLLQGKQRQQKLSLEFWLRTWGKKLSSHNKGLALLLLVVVGGSVGGIQQLQVDDILIENFKKSTEIYQADQLINQHFDGTSLLNIVLEAKFEADRENFFQDPQNLKIVEEIQYWLKENYSFVGDTLSIVDFLKKIRYAMNDNNSDFERLPESKTEIAQFLLLYSMSGGPDDFERYVDMNYTTVNILALVKAPPYKETIHLKQGLVQFLRSKGYDQKLTLKFGGPTSLNMTRVTLIVETLKNSILYSIVGVFVVCSLLFRSWVGGLLNLFAVLISIMINFAVMGYLGINVAVGTSLISSIIIGLGVDFSIHIISKYQLVLQKEPDWQKATEEVIGSVGVTLFISTVVIILGFCVLLFSQVPPTITIGALMSLAMFSSFIASIVFLPLLILFLKPNFLLPKQTIPQPQVKAA